MYKNKILFTSVLFFIVLVLIYSSFIGQGISQNMLVYFWVFFWWIIYYFIVQLIFTKFFTEKQESKYSFLAQNIILENTINNKDPIIIYSWQKWFLSSKKQYLIFWNDTMEKLSWYSFDEVRDKEKWEIMQLLYWHDKEEFDKVSFQLEKIDNYWSENSNLVFSLRTKEWRIKPIAWRIEKKYWWWSIYYWSTEQVEIQRVLRKDPAFNCLNANALKDDFIKILSTARDSDNLVFPNTLSFVFWDIDFFKTFNDTYWHKMWDTVLEYVIAFLKFEFRREWDWIYRKWWDEFVLLCDKTNEKNTYDKIEKVRLRLASTNIVATYDNWTLRTSHIKHLNPELAKKYFENKEIQKQNDRILQDMWMKKDKDWKIQVAKQKISWILVLPPIWTTWWVVEYAYDKKEIKQRPIEEIKQEIIDKADKLMYNWKQFWKWVVFTQEIVENLLKQN